MNPLTLLKYRSKLKKSHPKAMEFIEKVLMPGLPVGTVVEMSVIKPGEEKKTTNIKITQEDYELINEIKNKQ